MSVSDRAVAIGLVVAAAVIVGVLIAAGSFGVWSFIAGLLIAAAASLSAYALGCAHGWRDRTRALEPYVVGVQEALARAKRRAERAEKSADKVADG